MEENFPDDRGLGVITVSLLLGLSGETRRECTGLGEENGEISRGILNLTEEGLGGGTNLPLGCTNSSGKLSVKFPAPSLGGLFSGR